MTKTEVKKIISYLSAAYPKADWGDKKSADATAKIWEDIMITFPFDVAQEACKLWLFDGNKFFPHVAEFIKVCDGVWQRHEEKKRQEHGQAIVDSAKYLFHQPIENIEDNYKKQAVQLIRDVCNGEIKFKSPEWVDRFGKIFGQDASEYY